MRKIYTLLLFACCVAQAQVPNADFEAGLGYGGEVVANWGQFFPIPISIDMETGETTQDEIFYGEGAIGTFCTSTAFYPHSGERAMLIRNAFNATQNVVIPGEANLFNSGISEMPTGWNFGVPVAADADIQLLSFWYQFAPLGNDVAQAQLNLFNADSEEIGYAKILISEATSHYTYASVPITFTGVGNPAFLTISFNMQAEGSSAVFGSHLIVDDLAVNNSALATHQFNTSAFSIFPTLAQNTIQIQGTFNGKIKASIANAEGRVVSQDEVEMQSGAPLSVDVSQLAAGVYFIKLENGSQSFVRKFIKK